jgi:transcription termination factor Rho
VLEKTERGAWYLRDPKKHLAATPEDPEAPAALVQRFNLRGGELIGGAIEATRNGGPVRSRLASIDQIEGKAAAEWQSPRILDEGTAIDPDQRIRFDTPGGPLSMRIMELFTPVGLGQRALIVAAPRTGKTTLLLQIAHAVAVNHPDVYMIVLLVDERPEEVTEMRRQVHGEVIASSNDRDVSSHVRIARLVIERSRRLVEQGRDVVVLLDSITRLGRAFNNYISSSGRTMTGGLDIRALQEPKQMFGAARNVEGGGSLTIIASALVQTGSRADEFIFQEFKGTGNMELVLDRELANLRIWPAIDLQQSGTRKEEKLLTADELGKVNLLRRFVLDQPPNKRIPTLLEKMEKFPDLASFLGSLQTKR